MVRARGPGWLLAGLTVLRFCCFFVFFFLHIAKAEGGGCPGQSRALEAAVTGAWCTALGKGPQPPPSPAWG